MSYCSHICFEKKWKRKVIEFADVRLAVLQWPSHDDTVAVWSPAGLEQWLRLMSLTFSCIWNLAKLQYRKNQPISVYAGVCIMKLRYWRSDFVLPYQVQYDFDIGLCMLRYWSVQKRRINDIEVVYYYIKSTWYRRIFNIEVSFFNIWLLRYRRFYSISIQTYTDVDVLCFDIKGCSILNTFNIEDLIDSPKPWRIS